MPLTIFSYKFTYRWFQIKVCPEESRSRVTSVIFQRTPWQWTHTKHSTMSKSCIKFEPLFYFQWTLCICPGEQVRYRSVQRFLQFLCRSLIVLRKVFNHKEVRLSYYINSWGYNSARDGRNGTGWVVLTWSVTLRTSFRNPELYHI